jgi:hypothetical protein
MELLYSRAGWGVHKKSVSVCIRISGRTRKETAVFGTFTSDLSGSNITTLRTPRWNRQVCFGSRYGMCSNVPMRDSN